MNMRKLIRAVLEVTRLWRWAACYEGSAVNVHGGGLGCQRPWWWTRLFTARAKMHYVHGI
jgi:hypothetical protein